MGTECHRQLAFIDVGLEGFTAAPAFTDKKALILEASWLLFDGETWQHLCQLGELLRGGRRFSKPVFVRGLSSPRASFQRL